MSIENNKPIEQKAPDVDILSSTLHGNVYQAPDELKKWFAHKGEKIYSQGREQWLSPYVVTWNEVRDGRRAYQDDDYDQEMFDDLRNYCYSERFKSQIANPSVLDESTGKSYQIPANYKPWFNQNRLEIEDASADDDDSDSESNLSGNEKINGVITLKQLRSYCDKAPEGDERHKKIIDLDNSFYRQRFKSKLTQAKVVAHDGNVYQVPQDMKPWFEQNRCNIEKTGSGDFDGTITTSELNAFSDASPEGSDNQMNVNTLYQSFYKQQFKSQTPDSTVLGDNGFVHKIPERFKPWFDQLRANFDTTIEASAWDGKITTAELIAYYKNFANSDDRNQLTDLLKHCYQQRFKQVNLINGRDGTTHELPAHLQKWLNQTGWERDMMNGQPDGKITIAELQEKSEQFPASDSKMINELRTLVVRKTNDENNTISKSFEAQVSKDPASLKSWFEQHKSAIDLNKNGLISDGELLQYNSSNALNAYDRTMTLGLYLHAKTFNKMTDHHTVPSACLDNRAAYFSSDDINVAVKLALHQLTPAQIAYENTINPTKLGATLGAVSGGAFGLSQNVGSAAAVIASWGAGSEAAMGAIGATAGAAVGGAIAGALTCAAIAAGLGYGYNYYQANNWLAEKNKVLRTAHLMK